MKVDDKNQHMRNALELFRLERERQIKKEGWVPELDDEHLNGELARAAACYATPASARTTPIKIGDREVGRTLSVWPWDLRWWKPSPRDRMRELTKAGALLIAEMERLMRKEEQNEK